MPRRRRTHCILFVILLHLLWIHWLRNCTGGVLAHVDIIPFVGARFGAEVRSVALASPVAPDVANQLRDALKVHGVLLWRQQHGLSEANIMEAASLFGRPVRAEGQESAVAIYRVLDRDGRRQPTDFWHSDNSYMPTPGGPTLLYALKVPRTEDGTPLGDTVFVDAVVAQEGLPDALRVLIQGRRAVHHPEHNGGEPVPLWAQRPSSAELPDVSHPVLRPHPTTGQEAIYVAPAYVRHIVGLSPMESQELLSQVYAHTFQQRYMYRHQWTEGDVLVWDNDRVMHRATTLDMPPGVERLMWRVQTNGQNASEAAVSGKHQRCRPRRLARRKLQSR